MTDGTNSKMVPVSVSGGTNDAASVVAFELTPPNVILSKGGKRQFATRAIWSDGVTRPVAVTSPTTTPSPNRTSKVNGTFPST